MRRFFLSGLVLLSLLAAAWADETYDVVVYEGTPAGVMAAVAAGRKGHSVVLLEMNRHVGGMVSGGLCETDMGDKKTVGGLAHEFFQNILKYYSDKYGPHSEQLKATRDAIKFEPHVAEEVFDKMLADAHVTVLKRLRYHGVNLAPNGDIVSIVVDDLDNGGTKTFAGKIFIDGSYEGDLMAGAKVPYRVGREARDEYDEVQAGIQAPPSEKGKADGRLMSYNYRVNVTDDVNNRVLFPKPANYDPAPFGHYLAEVKKKKAKGLVDILASGPGRLGPNHKFDLNWGDLADEANLGYADADWPTREKIAAHYRDSFESMLYYLQSELPDPTFHAGMQSYGLPKDEFPDTDHFPFQLYVREARRMVGQFVLTAHDITQERYKPDGIAEGSYGVDCHIIREVEVDGKRVPDKTPHTLIPGYDIPYGCLIPPDKDGMPKNLLVPVCCSTSHVAYCSLRMEPVYMMLGHASGDAAALALDGHIPVQKVDVAELRKLLRAEGAQLDWNYEPQIKIAWTPQHPKPNEPVSFHIETGEVRDPLTHVWWDFAGQGKVSAEGKEAQTIFPLEKVYTVALLVEDSAKRRRWVQAKVPVGAAAVGDVDVDDFDGQMERTWEGRYPEIVPHMIPDVYSGPSCHYSVDKGAGSGSIRLEGDLPKDGRYAVCLGFRPNEKQASQVPVTVESAEGKTQKSVNQQTETTPFPFYVLGEFKCHAGKQNAVEVDSDNADGTVAVDGARWVWLGE